MNIKYILGSILGIPLLPIMYFQGKKIRASVPRLPEAKGIEGVCVKNSDRVLEIMTIGESTIAGVGVETHSEGFTGTFANEIANKLNATINWKVYARSGYTAIRIKEKIIPKIEESSVDLIVIGLGGNDAFTLNSPAKWKKHIHELILEIKIKFNETPIVFTNMPPIKHFPAFTPVIKFTIGNLVEILGDELKEVCAEYENVYYYSRKITLEDWVSRLKIKAEPSEFFSDGVHPSKLTYQAWGKDITNFIISNDALVKKILKHN